METIISATEVELQLTLPSNVFGAEQTLEITAFARDTASVKYGFLNPTVANIKEATDGTAQGFSDPSKTRYIEFAVTPYSDADKILTRFNQAKQTDFGTCIFKDKNMGIKLQSEKVTFAEATETIVSLNPDDKTYRILLLQPVVENF